MSRKSTVVRGGSGFIEKSVVKTNKPLNSINMKTTKNLRIIMFVVFYDSDSA
jgi:hypothetical protein